MLLGVSTSVQVCRVAAAYGNQVAWPGSYVRTLDRTADAGSLCHDGGPKSSITANDPSSWHQQTADLTMTSPRESLRNLNSKTLQNLEKLTIGTKHENLFAQPFQNLRKLAIPHLQKFVKL